MSNCKPIKLTDIWRSCNKIRAAIFRLGFDIRKFFEPLDPQRNNLISEADFKAVLGGPLRDLIGLSHQEVSDIADYFRVQDGRVLYAQMCDVLQGENVSHPKTTPYFNGTTEGSGSLRHRRGTFSLDQERRLKVLMTTIASRKLVLRPYFQDYEIVAKQDGRVTFAHFARILTLVGVLVSSEDLNLLMRRFVSDSCCVDYEEFMSEVEKTAAAGHAVNANPRRTIDTSEAHQKIQTSAVLSGETDSAFIGNTSTRDLAKEIEVPQIMRKIQRHVLERGIRPSGFFQVFDFYNMGTVSLGQFARALDVMGVGHCGKVALSPAEVFALSQFYGDPQDEKQVCWKTFADDLDQVFSIKDLEHHPDIDAKATMESRAFLPKQSHTLVPPRIRQLIKGLSINLKPFFQNFDQYKLGRVRPQQLLQVLVRSGLRQPIPDLEQLQENFEQSGDFNYRRFLRQLEIDDEPREDGQTAEDVRNTLEAARWPEQAYEDFERDITAVLAHIKSKVSRERIGLKYFFEQYDPLKSSVISRGNFQRAIIAAGIGLTPVQLDTVMDVFAAPMRNHQVEYLRLCRVVEECFGQPGLERVPLVVPVQHLASEDSGRNFLSHPERALLTSAMEKLATMPDVVSNISEVFKDSDFHNCGSISKSQFMRSLSIRDMFDFLTPAEADAVCKRFAVVRGTEKEVDYRTFSEALNVLHPAVKRQKRNQCC